MASPGASTIAGEVKANPGEVIVTYEDASHAEEGAVQFSHPAHKRALGKEKLDCKQCHVKPKLLLTKRQAGIARKAVPIKAMAKGKACGGCHNGKTTVNDKALFNVVGAQNYGRCHRKK